MVDGELWSAPGQTRTGTALASLRILSPVCLPIPPPGLLSRVINQGEFRSSKSGWEQPEEVRLGESGRSSEKLRAL